ncbi:hypothetical protein DFH08DRAFT_1044856 [Mycena albidolilacea]|uniref:Uncharacterized protein n=1 Tax=Mycena albidolilacea TaxID=1033008 RepID=A0AAD7EDA3_9AGAR|nr:hypothetical protein DFH08DRAFT_1044856 [Mycena albidolilacea]
MTANKRAIGDTEDEFQAALATYTKAGNKTAAMRRLWNAAYEKGNSVAREAEAASQRMYEATRKGFVEGRKAGFEEGRRAGEKEAMQLDALEIAFSKGRMEGFSMGMGVGRDEEEERWKGAGHFEGGECCSSPGVAATCAVETTPPPPTATDDSTNIMSLLTGFDWADDADLSLPIHTAPSTPQKPRDFSDLRSSSKNAFNTLQRRHSRHHGSRANTIRRRQFYCSPPAQFTRSTSRQSDGTTSWLGVLAWASAGWLAQAAVGGMSMGVFGCP